jgi:hypothetical protein
MLRRGLEKSRRDAEDVWVREKIGTEGTISVLFCG